MYRTAPEQMIHQLHQAERGELEVHAWRMDDGTDFKFDFKEPGSTANPELSDYPKEFLQKFGVHYAGLLSVPEVVAKIASMEAAGDNER